MHRLDRRIRLLRGKRDGAFDPNQYYLERAFRARAARKVRLMLRRMQPVILITPRWSAAPQFLDDLTVDLAIGKPRIECRTLSMAPVIGRSVHEARTWVVRALQEFTGATVDGPVSQAVDRQGFRHVMAEMLSGARTGPRRALLIHQLEHLHVEARDDLIKVFEEHMAEFEDERRVNLLLAGSVDVPTFEMAGAERVVLVDYSGVEAVEALAEHSRPIERAVLQRAVDVVGGVPELLHRLGSNADERGGRIAENREEIFRDLGPLTDEIRGAIDIVEANELLASRFEEIAQLGPLPFDEQKDLPLVRAGLVQERYGGRAARVEVRCPAFSQMALG